MVNKLHQIKIIRTSTVPSSLKTLLKGQLRFMSENGFEVIGVSSNGKELQEIVVDERIPTIAIDMARHINLLQDIISLWKLYWVFRKEKPTIVHSITPKAGLLSMLAGKGAGVPIRIHTFTGLIFPTKTGWMQKLLIQMDRLLCWAATNVYPEGEGVKNDLISFKITSKPLKVLANGNVNGIDIQHFNSEKISETQKSQLKQQLGIAENDFVFVFVGRLVGDKGINELVKAFSNLTNSPTLQLPNPLKLLLVGGKEEDLDPLRPETLRLIKEENNIIEVGFQEDIRPYLSISNVLILASYREGFPNVVLQAGAMELPSIVSDVNGCNEIIIEGKNGLIIPSKNVKQLAEKMLLLSENKKLYNSLKSNSRKMITERYEQSVVWNAILSEYKKLLSQKINK